MTTPEVKSVMLNKFIPALHELLRSANPDEYERWQGNCCRQTAIIGAALLSELLPAYEWTAWDGWFRDKLMGRDVEYNHAWIYGEGPDGNLLVDLARQHKERLFMEVNSNRYPSDHPEYKDMTEVMRAQLDVSDMIERTEYYTGRTGIKILNQVKKMMKEVLA